MDNDPKSSAAPIPAGAPNKANKLNKPVTPLANLTSGRIKFRHLQCFLAVTQFGSVQRAADSLSITQPAVSKTIGELESILGVRLFERGRRGAAPTRDGRLFAPHAAACVGALREGVDELSRHGVEMPGTGALAGCLRAGMDRVKLAVARTPEIRRYRPGHRPTVRTRRHGGDDLRAVVP